MNTQSLYKLRAGNTLYVVARSAGVVNEVYVRKVKKVEGFPLLVGDARTILSAGLLVLSPKTIKDAACWFAPLEPSEKRFLDDNYRQTTSRKQAFRWAKEGFQLYGKPLTIEYIVTMERSGQEAATV